MRLIRLSRMPLAWMRTLWYWHQDPHLIDFRGQTLRKSNSFDRPPSTLHPFFAWDSCMHRTTKWNKFTYQGYVTSALASSWRWSLLVFTVKPNGILSLCEPNLEPKCATILDLPHHMHVHYTKICFQRVFVHSHNYSLMDLLSLFWSMEWASMLDFHPNSHHALYLPHISPPYSPLKLVIPSPFPRLFIFSLITCLIWKEAYGMWSLCYENLNTKGGEQWGIGLTTTTMSSIRYRCSWLDHDSHKITINTT